MRSLSFSWVVLLGVLTVACSNSSGGGEANPGNQIEGNSQDQNLPQMGENFCLNAWSEMVTKAVAGRVLVYETRSSSPTQAERVLYTMRMELISSDENSIVESTTMILEGVPTSFESEPEVSTQTREEFLTRCDRGIGSLSNLPEGITISNNASTTEETITTPAGTFNANVVRQTSKVSTPAGSGEIRMAHWFTDDFALKTEMTNEPGPTVQTTELISIENP